MTSYASDPPQNPHNHPHRELYSHRTLIPRPDTVPQSEVKIDTFYTFTRTVSYFIIIFLLTGYTLCIFKY
uniref:Uncharacterized protein n=1 Tax=Anguilla anguilla TaxID=7936 RepID=A0A0E9XMP4_ANGAN